MIRTALITAAGRSTRMGGGIKKEYRLINGVTVLEKIVSLFTETKLFSAVAVTCPPGEKAAFEERLEAYREDSLLITEGGATRQESVLRGLDALQGHPGIPAEALVLIHDGARPWLSLELLQRILKTAEQHGTALPVVPSVNAVKSVNDQGWVEAHLPRSRTVGAQTPQAFPLAAILKCHRQAAAEGRTDFIDDSELFQIYQGRVKTLPGDPANKKITYPEDISSPTPYSGMENRGGGTQ